jgi:predicted  nucleic acid-binding Zn-ribbon protein
VFCPVLGRIDITGGAIIKWGMSVAKQLYELQELDLELESREQALAQVMAQLGEGQALFRARERLAAAKQRLEGLGHKQHTLEWEIADVSTKIAGAEEELYSGRTKNPKELSNLQHEIEVLKTKRSELEDQAIEVMEQVEAAAAAVGAMERELETLEAEWRAEQKKLAADKERLEAELERLKQKRATASSQVESEIVDFYAELKKQKGTAVALVEQGVCRGCRLSLSNAELQRARSGGLMQCSSCGRILFLA